MRPIRLMSGVLLLLLAGVLVPLGAAPASAALPSRGILYDASSSDGPSPERDWFSADVSHDATTGRLWGSFDLSATPTAATAATWRVWLGNIDGSTCRAFALVGGSTVPGPARAPAERADRVMAAGPSDGERPGRSGRARALVSQAFDVVAPVAAAPATCFWFDLAEGGATESAILDGTDGDFALLETIDPTTLSTTAEDQRVRVKKWVTVPVRVTNTGDVAATGVTVTLRRTPKVTPKTATIVLGDLAPGATGSATVRVRVTGAGRREVRYDVTAADGVETRTDSFLLATTPPPPRASGSLAGLHLWRTEILTGVRNWDNHGLFFVDGKFAYRGFPEAGLPRCRRVTATLTGDGCVRYWYDARTRRLQVDTERGRSLGPTRRPDGVKLGSDAYTFELVMPRKGARLEVDLVNTEAFMCPGPACVTATTTVALGSDGSYALGSSAGSYVVGDRGRITFRAGDGTTSTSSLWIQTDRKGRPQPTREGIVLGDVNYYP